MPTVRPLGIKAYLRPYYSKISFENACLNGSRRDPATFKIGSGDYFSGNRVHFVKYAFDLSLTVQQNGTVIKTPLLLCHNGARNITILLSGNIRQHTGDRSGSSFILCNLLECF